MSRTYRRHSLVQGSVEDVWAIVSDPRTHADWWPEVEQVDAPPEIEEGDQYTRVSRRLGFLDMVDAVWVVERLDHLKEAHFRCTLTGTYARFALTPAQDETFVEIEAGTVPTGVQGRILQATSPLWLSRWLGELLDALSQAAAAESESEAGADTSP